MATSSTIGPINLLTYLFGKPDTLSFGIEQRTNPPWFDPGMPACYAASDPQNKTFTFGELKDHVKALGSGLRKAGMRDGERLILMAPDSIYIGIAMLGTWAAGGTFIARGIDFTAEQQADFIKHAQPSFILAEESFLDTAVEAVRMVGALYESVYRFNGMKTSFGAVNDPKDWNSLFDRSDGRDFAWKAFAEEEEMQAGLLIEYTSGTTSTPKGVEHTHRSLINACVMHGVGPPMPMQLKLFVDFAWAYMGAKFLFMGSLASRVLSIIYDIPGPFSTDTYLCHIGHIRPQVVAITKRAIDGVVSYEGKPELSFVHSIVASTQIIPTKTRLAIKEICGGRNVLTVSYASTESLVLTRKEPSDAPGESSNVGRLLPGVEGKVVDDVGKTVPNGGQGRMVFRTACLMKGYWREPELTAATVDKDGWYDSGDLGYVDAETGEWNVTGRTKEVIKVQGKPVNPNAIEETLLKISGVALAVVVSVMRDDGEELPTAFLVREGSVDESKLGTEDVHAFMKKKMNNDHQITGGVLWRTNLPYTGQGKTGRMQLKKAAQELWDQGELKFPQQAKPIPV